MSARLATNRLVPALPARLLVIDDEFRVRRVIAATLSRARHHVKDVASGAAALSLLAHDSAFDLILCDMMMPEMSGADLFHELCTAHPLLSRRFAFVSAGSTCARGDALLRSRRVELLLKPFSPDELLAFVDSQLVACAARTG